MAFTRRNRPWKPEEDALLREMAEAGKSPFLASARLKRSASAVKDRASTLRISLKTKRQPSTEEGT